MTTATAFRIRRAEEHRDWRALRMLLPEAIHHGCGCDVFVATDDDASRRIVAAVATSPQMRLAPERGPKVALHTIEPWRRRGVARTLLQVVADLAAARGANALYAWNPLDPTSEAAQSWHRLGFDRTIECPLNRIDASRTVELLNPLFDRLQARGQIPAEARMVYLRDADLDEIVELVTTHLGGAGAPDNLKNRLLGRHPNPMDPILSRVLVYRDRVVGVMLARPIDRHVVWVDANVVHPSVRGRWANVWLKLDPSARARDMGYSAFIYETYQQHTDTSKLTNRLAGVLVPRVELYRRIAASDR
jgi:GNAT superfamily N-acetyltransferase